MVPKKLRPRDRAASCWPWCTDLSPLRRSSEKYADMHRPTAIDAKINSPSCALIHDCAASGRSVGTPKYQSRICTSIGTFWWYATNAATALVARGTPDARSTASTTPSPTARVQLVAVSSKVLIAPDTSRCAKGPAKIGSKSRRPDMHHSFCQIALAIHIQLTGYR